MRQNLSDDFLKVIFRFSSRHAVSLSIATVRRSLMLRFVPHNIGLNALVVAPDRYILDIHGPYFSDSRNNDALML